MKTKIYIFALSVIGIIQCIGAQGNNYVWIHGLNGTADSWHVYQNIFTPNNGTRPAYKSDKSITEISKEFYNTNRALFGKNTILIGHSMGGLVARELERNHSSLIKGIVTIGTGHQGAQFAKEIHFGGLNKLKDKVTLRVNACATSTFAALSFTFPGLTKVLIPIGDVLNGISSVMTSPIGDIALNEIAAVGFNKSCTDDLQPGSKFLTTLGQRKINVPILTFASEEDRWQLARTVHCQLNYKKLATDPNINSDGNFDMKGYNLLNSINNSIKIGGQIHTGLAATHAVIGFWNPYHWAASAAHGIAAANWFSTAHYIDNGLDYDHAVLIGASRVEKVERKILFLRWFDYITIPESHDGIVSVKSQQLDKLQGINVIWANSTIKGVNHMEQRNHPKTKEEFKLLLEGKTYAPQTYNNSK